MHQHGSRIPCNLVAIDDLCRDIGFGRELRGLDLLRSGDRWRIGAPAGRAEFAPMDGRGASQNRLPILIVGTSAVTQAQYYDYGNSRIGRAGMFHLLGIAALGRSGARRQAARGLWRESASRDRHEPTARPRISP
jgi:hypothetical protein